MQTFVLGKTLKLDLGLAFTCLVKRLHNVKVAIKALNAPQ
jgi:hypothetical protein